MHGLIDLKGTKFMLKRYGLLTLALWAVCSLSVWAHETWLAARQTAVMPGTVVLLDLTSGMSFPTLETAIKPERVAQARYRLHGQTLELTADNSAPKSLLFSARPEVQGVVTCWVELKPRALELTPKQVEEYFAEINATPAIRQAWAAAGKTRRWRELYTKHAKTFVRVGAPEDDRSWAEPAGLAFEIVPERDPTTLRAGDELPVHVLQAGAPLANFPLGIVRAGNGHGVFQQTDAQGRVIFKLTRAGRWLLYGTKLRPATKPETEWESDFTTLTIELRAQPMRGQK